MLEDEIYREKIPFPVMKLVVAVMVAFTLLFLGLFLYQLLVGPIGENPAPNWCFLVMFLIFTVINVVIFNFRELTISITPGSLRVAYGRISYVIAWDNVADCYLDKNPGMAYGGWGIRIGRTAGKSVLVYNVMSTPCITLTLKRGRFAQFAFSTRQPEELMGIVQQRIGK